jgi:membrane-associated phospholipid phosphatase
VLSDGFANPITASALITGRESTVDARNSGPYQLAAPDYSASGFGGRFDRWEPWVRMNVALQTLCGRLCFEATGDGTSAATARTVSVYDRNTAQGGASLLLAKLTAPLPAVFERQLCMVLRWAELREERLAEVLSQIENQTAMVSSVAYLHPTRTPRTLELLAVALQFAVSVEMRFKHELACWRPVEYSPQVQPMITTPGHGSLPSGHATQAYIVAEVLAALLNVGSNPTHPVTVQLQRQAARIATNRVIAGVHFPVDNIAGRMLGVKLGQFFVACANRNYNSPSFGSGVFDGTLGNLDTYDRELHPELQPLDGGGGAAPFYAEQSAACTIAQDDVLNCFWDKAQAEWRGRLPFGSIAPCKP